GTPEGTVLIPQGGSYTVHGEDLIGVIIPGLASLRISGPQTDAAKWNAEIAAGEKELVQLCEPLGSSAVDILAARTERRTELEVELRNLESNRIELLVDQRAEDLSTTVARVSAELAKIRSTEPEWETNKPDG